MNQIHQREIALIRAIYNVGTDLYESVASGKKPNKYKIMGLLNAILVGRVAILFGSLVGTVFIFVQIYYLYRQTEIVDNQNRLIQEQTSFMKFEQLSRIRELFKEDATRDEIAEYGLTNGPSEANIAIVENLVKDDKEAINKIFPVLLHDKDLNVRIGAIKVLANFDSLLDENQELYISLERAQIDDIDFTGMPIKSFLFTDCLLNRCKISSFQNFKFIAQETIVVNSTLIGHQLDSVIVTVRNSFVDNFTVSSYRFEQLNFGWTISRNLYITAEKNPTKFRYLRSTEDVKFINVNSSTGRRDTLSIEKLKNDYSVEILPKQEVLSFWSTNYGDHYYRITKLSPYIHLIPF